MNGAIFSDWHFQLWDKQTTLFENKSCIKKYTKQYSHTFILKITVIYFLLLFL